MSSGQRTIYIFAICYIFAIFDSRYHDTGLSSKILGGYLKLVAQSLCSYFII